MLVVVFMLVAYMFFGWRLDVDPALAHNGGAARLFWLLPLAIWFVGARIVRIEAVLEARKEAEQDAHDVA